ncbi:RhoGEF guanine nucleotide exchange factor for RhoRacCdc42-like GTPase [Ecytonucleospora hepatopenaei]|uniref:RhoGEF guanine nucleotide exchange factor for RhoRacCdc42-like GTPase n=1 Tax=Ecytonucleospora hepatopenaei TaxID=646526 RepID=A0A1W0E723_9MICR|nr:RhoGEF guanine nucleotide exchange factor for RhoRacCdc42-like GTPase [Ecytonucleospora hepatopenaei]
MYDPYTCAFLETIKCLNAKKIFRVNEDLFLVCYEGVGFYVDRVGRCVQTHISFNWEEEAKYFKMYKKWLFVLSEHYVSVFCLMKGCIIFQKGFKKGKFVEGERKPLIYNETGLYEMVMVRKIEQLTYREDEVFVKSEVKGKEGSKASKIYSEKRMVKSDDELIKSKTVKKEVKMRKPRRKEETKIANIEEVYKLENKSSETICEIVKMYEEKYKNYKYMTLKLV